MSRKIKVAQKPHAGIGEDLVSATSLERLSPMLVLVADVCFLSASFLASLALLCWSANILFIAAKTGANFDAAPMGTPQAVISPAIAVMIIAVSFIAMRCLKEGVRLLLG